MEFNSVEIPADGIVSYCYRIMTAPVTNAQYCAWLNDIPNDMAKKHYCKLMASHFWGGIIYRTELKHSSYKCKDGFEKKPVVFVSWDDAQSFAKWYGWRLPTAVEWRKAAAWIPQEKRFALYCTGCDKPPTQKEVVYYDYENGWALPSPHMADVDWYQPSGAYGLRGMAGNIGEWVDATMANGWKMALGGSLFRPLSQTRTFAAEGDAEQKRLSTFGFRLVRNSAI